MAKEDLLAALQPILAVLPTVDVSDPARARAALEARFPVSSLAALRTLVRQGVVDGWLCDKENAGVRFSRVQKATAATSEQAGPPFSVDAVHMHGRAVGHTHPNGEIDLCFAVGDGAGSEARFDGHPEGWVVYDKATWHVPTVTGGTMDILYFLPAGAIRFEDQPSSPASSSAVSPASSSKTP